MKITKKDIINGIMFIIIIPFAFIGWLLTSSARIADKLLDDMDGEGE